MCFIHQQWPEIWISFHCWPCQRWNTDFLILIMNSAVIALLDVIWVHGDFCPLGAQLAPQSWNMVISHSYCVKLVFLSVCLTNTWFSQRRGHWDTKKRWALVCNSENILLHDLHKVEDNLFTDWEQIKQDNTGENLRVTGLIMSKFDQIYIRLPLHTSLHYSSFCDIA